MVKWGYILALLLFAVPVHAVEEICGNGLDDDSSGGDLSCGGIDGDADGYGSDGTGTETGTDCDDTNRYIFPGIWVSTGCSAGQAKECQADGTYTACGAPSEGSGTQYFINFTSGTDGGACTSGSPCKTFLQFVNYYDPGDEPTGYHGLSAGDTLWFMGGTDTSTYTYNTKKRAFYLRNNSGSSGSPIRLIAPVGSSAAIAPTGCNSGTPCSPIALETSDYVSIYGLDISGGYQDGGEPLEGSGICADGDNIVIVGNVIHDNHGPNSANPCGINGSIAPNNWDIGWNRIYDNYDTTAGVNENERGICMFQGSANRIHHNLVYNTVAHTDANSAAGCIVWKLGQSEASNEIDHNILWNCFQTAIGSGNSGTHIHHNLMLDSERWVMLQDFGGTTYVRDNIIEYNTTKNAGFAEINADVSAGGFAANNIRYNVIVDDDASMGNEDALQTVYTYGSNALRTSYLVGGYHVSNNNCYYNSAAATLQFCDYCSDAGSQTAGSLLTYAGWQAAGFDATSFNEDPTLDTKHIATAANCDEWGYRLTEAGGGGGGGGVPGATTNFLHWRMRSL